ncbi:MAG: 23S rRNA (pseudouridine(1915)-N(3))-methyltransferase RlmH [Sphingomonadales bacterium]|nr:23S rRNA (pseudouridine(1915)-N(3))-methyltransferase RlmH [Sphingomonadales bacterium]NCO49729.1 23S rRNA (pseudouridine(1915)-N(3))-methyltransferase RlmH [Sphingomonadales bacterium]NCP00990.1 23S rRNA (pseudouridine(1915)-N(3))-methyltransferase RlmH [Sphingomonadales bacterium]NCP25639.1 23S rRNA (pseudouridine(1915)-N(3))-methyltransferase RlmH [Sphingomonadales bacterium]NCP49116.1 23S rRNA (pseudouridine(1915)-N(3))-methyltransferase RlmH [Sphingomonadales bacterium]
MRLHIVARGKIGRSPEAELVDRYVKRIGWEVKISELPDQGGKSPKLQDHTRIIALDETGESWTSSKFARLLSDWRDNGAREARFLIGAADGLSAEERASADHFFSFGKATWPHMMARAMLAEQLFRATSIIAGHPYHREG